MSESKCAGMWRDIEKYPVPVKQHGCITRAMSWGTEWLDESSESIAEAGNLARINDLDTAAGWDKAEIDRLLRQRDELLIALKEARENISDWGSYASDYFREKWNLAGDIEATDKIIKSIESEGEKHET